jgi:hypothetical protein
MPTQNAREYRSPLADEYCQLYVHLTDIHFSIDCLRILIELYDAEKEADRDTNIQRRALYRSALLTFLGCFDQGYRGSLDPEVIYQEKVSNHEEVFKHLWDIRDSYIAHHFGAMRQCHMGIIKMPDMFGVGPIALDPIVPSLEILKGYHDFMVPAENWLQDRLPELHKAIHDEASKLSVKDVASLPPLSLGPLRSDAIRTARPNAPARERKPRVRKKGRSNPGG